MDQKVVDLAAAGEHSIPYSLGANQEVYAPEGLHFERGDGIFVDYQVFAAEGLPEEGLGAEGSTFVNGLSRDALKALSFSTMATVRNEHFYNLSSVV